MPLSERLYQRHKEIFASAAAPVLLGATFLLVVLHWSNSWRFYLAVMAILALDIFNVYFSHRHRPFKTPWGIVDTRSDNFDTFRACVNFPVNVFVLWSLRVSYSSAGLVWLIFTLGAMSEIYFAKNRAIALAIAFLGFALITHRFDASGATKIYGLSAYCGILYFLFRYERWLNAEMKNHLYLEQVKIKLQTQAQYLRRQAVVQNQTRLLGWDAAALADSEDGLPVTKSYLATHLCLDFQTLLKQQFGQTQEFEFTLTLPAPNELSGYEVREHTGTAYLILQHLINCAIKSTAELAGDNRRAISVAVRVQAQALIVEVRDNGAGRIAETWRIVRQGRVPAAFLDEKALDLCFIIEQAGRDHMQIQFEGQSNGENRFVFKIPLAPASSEEIAA